MKPIRDDRRRTVAHNPWDSSEHAIDHIEISHALTDQGSTKSSTTERRIACGCGCLRPTAGFCFICSTTACEACFGFCERCRAPLCPRHSVFRKGTKEGDTRRYCGSCADSVARAERVKGLARLVLSPFVRLKEDGP